MLTAELATLFVPWFHTRFCRLRVEWGSQLEAAFINPFYQFQAIRKHWTSCQHLKPFPRNNCARAPNLLEPAVRAVTIGGRNPNYIDNFAAISSKCASRKAGAMRMTPIGLGSVVLNVVPTVRAHKSMAVMNLVCRPMLELESL
jgi:hypothetical protein